MSCIFRLQCQNWPPQDCHPVWCVCVIAQILSIFNWLACKWFECLQTASVFLLCLLMTVIHRTLCKCILCIPDSTDSLKCWPLWKCCKPCVLWLFGDQSLLQFLGQSDGASEQLPCLRYSAYATYAHVISILLKNEIFCGACFFGIENFFAAYLSIKVWNFRTPFVLILEHFVSMLEHAQPGNSEQTQYANTHAACIPKIV